MAWITRCPLPSMYAFGVPGTHGGVLLPGGQENSTSLLTMRLPVSYVQFAELITVFGGPLNSSLQAWVQVCAALILPNASQSKHIAENARTQAAKGKNGECTAFMRTLADGFLGT